VTLRQAERITGLMAALSTRNGKGLYECNLYLEHQGEPPIVSGSGRLITEAIGIAVEANYKRVAGITFKEQGFRCFVCGAIRPLQCDHIKPRARGRDDRRQNLRGVDATCHRKITDNVLKYPEPHPSVAKSMRDNGWAWQGATQKGNSITFGEFGWVRI